ncbi:MAG: hypothetical protein M1835_008174 [Candelina submexicana]|nr:MAG: hypothetical protein M1835_008174 [Candelina submexicana]
MSTTTRHRHQSSLTNASTSTTLPSEKTYFEQQRDALVGEIAIVGNEFGSVEALWSQFENVMAKDPEAEAGSQEEEAQEGEEQEENEEGHATMKQERQA